MKRNNYKSKTALAINILAKYMKFNKISSMLAEDSDKIIDYLIKKYDKEMLELLDDFPLDDFLPVDSNISRAIRKLNIRSLEYIK